MQEAFIMYTLSTLFQDSSHSSSLFSEDAIHAIESKLFLSGQGKMARCVLL